MSASLLYHTNQIEDVQVLKEEYHTDKILFEAVFTPNKAPALAVTTMVSYRKARKYVSFEWHL